MRDLINADAIRRFLHPDGVVLIGRVMSTSSPQHLLTRERSRWGERFFFVNPSGGSVGDVPIYTTLADVPGNIDLAVISVGTRQVTAVLEDCASRGITNAVVFASGFGELGEEGKRLERELAATVERLGLTVLGPNTNTNAFEPMPAYPTHRTGKIGLITHSGNQGRPFVDAAPFGVSLSRWVPTGNEVDLDVADFIGFFAEDPDTVVVGAYVEGIRNPERLRRALQAADEADMPVVMLKMGQTEAGQRMAQSHTGHLTGSDAVVNGLFAQYGVTRVFDVDEMIETTNVFSKLPGHRGDRVAVYGASGGVTGLLGENVQRAGLRVPLFEQATQDALATILPDYLTRSNPVDNGMAFLTSAAPDTRLEVMRLMAADPNVDVIFAANSMSGGPIAAAFVDDLVSYVGLGLPVPVVCVWGTPVGDPDLFGRLSAAEIPIVRSGRAAASAVKALHDYNSRAKSGPRLSSTSAAADIAAILDGNEGVLSQGVSLRLIEAVGVLTCEEYVATSAADAASAWQRIGGPAVMKIASADFPHRSDYGLVLLDIGSQEHATRAYVELVERALRVNPAASIEGVIVQRQVGSGLELIVGATLDEVYGPAVTVGFGGALAELLADTAVRPAPLNEVDALEMLRSLRGFPLLEGFRGSAPVDINAIVRVIESVAALFTAAQGRLVELDINPLIVTAAGAVAVDVLVIASKD